MTVYLVGAGPGDPGLLTARALELIAAADVIVHDRLIPATALDGARPDAQLIYAGKEGGGPSASQAEIDALLREHGAAGREVVRLKGGDPFVFGRGGEEAEVLRAAGIRFEVVPGVTAGVAASAYAGIPVTHRDVSSAVAFVTGHEDPAKGDEGGTGSSLDWPALARFPGTLVFYMGVRRLGEIARQLVNGGRPPSEPAAVIERGTLADQRVVTGTLQDIAEVAAAAGVRAPAISLFGPVAALRAELAWFESRPLAGVTVAVTRARAQASGLAARLRGLGAAALEAPAIRVRELPGPAPERRALRPGLPDQPQRRAAAVRAPAPGRPRRPRLRRGARRRDRARDRGGAARARPHRRHRPRAVRRRGAGGGAGRRPGDAGAGRPGRRGPRRAPRCPARPRRRGRRRGPV